MQRNTTFNLPESLLARAKAYAANHRTSVTAIIREHLETVTATTSPDAGVDDALVRFAHGTLTKEQAIAELGLRDYAQLLVRLGDAGLALPTPPVHDLENQATLFEKLWALG